MGYCEHDAKEKRPLRIEGYDAPQLVCPSCWRRAIDAGLVPA